MKQPLVALVADRDMEKALQGLLQRHQALGIRPVNPRVFVHHRHDPGVLTQAHEFLRAFSDLYDHALVLFDREGCGQEQKTAAQLQQEVQNRLNNAGWRDRSQVIVLEPELEAWVWSDSPHVPSVLGTNADELAKVRNAFQPDPHGKPKRPEEAMEQVLRRSGIPRSSALYEELAGVSLQRCADPAFQLLRATLKKWFAQ